MSTVGDKPLTEDEQAIWDAATQSLRVAVLEDIAGAIRKLNPNVITFHKSCASCGNKNDMRGGVLCNVCTRNWNHHDHWREGLAQTANVPVSGVKPDAEKGKA